VAWGNLLEAARLAARGKRTRPDVAQFLLDLEPNLSRLQGELESGEYRPGGYRTFWIRDPKPRQISAAPFRDRVVHHALTAVLEKVFEPRFSPFSFASRKGFGQHRALRRAREAVARHEFYLKGDIRKYFLSIDHEILKSLLARAVKCPRTLDLAFRIVDGSNAQEESVAYFPGDDLFTPFERRRGLPIGNQTSQFFANVYLDPLDQFVVREVRPALYLRYVDDFVLFGGGKSEMRHTAGQIRGFLASLRLAVHERKFHAAQSSGGLTFLGWRLLPYRTRLARANAVRMRRKLAAMALAYHGGEIVWRELDARVQAWLGHASFGDTSRLRERLFAAFILKPVDRGRSARGFLEQQSGESPRLEP
jgi:hypothetical protein